MKNSKSLQIVRGAKCELSKREFYSFCQTLAPDFYKSDRTYLKDLCTEIEDFVSGPDDVLVVNAPPRHGKSRTVTLLCDWLFGKDAKRKIMIGSYNETLSETFSRDVRNLIDVKVFDGVGIVYSDIFPQVKIKRGDGAVTRWSLEGQHHT